MCVITLYIKSLTKDNFNLGIDLFKVIFLLQFTNIFASIIQFIYFYVKFMTLAFDLPSSCSPRSEMIIIFYTRRSQFIQIWINNDSNYIQVHNMKLVSLDLSTKFIWVNIWFFSSKWQCIRRQIKQLKSIYFIWHFRHWSKYAYYFETESVNFIILLCLPKATCIAFALG
jgi:hypothetical protein